MMSTLTLRSIAAVTALLISPLASQAQWTQVTDPFAGVTTEYHALGVSATGDVYLAGNNSIYRSTDQGKTWRLITVGLPAGQPVKSIGFTALNEPIAGVGNFPQGGGTASAYLYRNNKWIKASGISASLRVSAFALDKNNSIVAATGWHADIFRSTDYGKSFVQPAQAVGGSGTVSAGALWTIAKGPNGTLYTGGELPTGMYKSTDNGATWKAAGLDSTAGYKGNLTAIAFNDVGEVLANRQYNGSGLQRLTSSGWVTSSVGIPDYYWVMGLVITPSSGVLYSATFQTSKHLGTVYQSIDDGKTWRAFSGGLPTDGFVKLAISPDGYLYTVNYGGGLYRTKVAAP